MNENYLVTKSNTLITSNYDLSLQEQRIILTLASTVQPADEDFKPYKFKIAEFMELLGVEDKSKYSAIPKITKELMQKVLEIKQGNKILQVAWLSSAEYEKGSGMVELEFSPKLKPFMLGLKEFYTSYRLKNVLELKGKYSIRMYEILKSNEFKKVAEIEVDELRKILKADTGSYLIYQNFKNRIILQAQKELKEKTDICFEFKEKKAGRKVSSLVFSIKRNNKATEEICVDSSANVSKNDFEGSDGLIAAVKMMFESTLQKKVSTKAAIEILMSAKSNEKYGHESIDLIQEVLQYSKTQNIDTSLIGWFKATVKNYERPIKVPKRDNFNNYEQRTYDFDKLEKGLLGWKVETDIDGEEYQQATINPTEV